MRQLFVGGRIIYVQGAYKLFGMLIRIVALEFAPDYLEDLKGRLFFKVLRNCLVFTTFDVSCFRSPMLIHIVALEFAPGYLKGMDGISHYLQVLC